ncbi:MAG TPA: aa3-type cytochrome c oxidase subunit IV [Pseudolabrys sp.]|nr:aa3-type cytochrome c oxidase subunit IV [Pseudolabrys sp.]
MADHGTVEYATATGNDYPAHEGTYERFVLFAFVGIIHVVNLLFGLAVGGVMGHWFWALPIFFLAVVGAVSGLLSGSKTSSYVAFVICFLIFAFVGLSGQ